MPRRGRGSVPAAAPGCPSASPGAMKALSEVLRWEAPVLSQPPAKVVALPWVRVSEADFKNLFTY